MPISFIDPAEGALAHAFGKAAEAAANRLNEKKIRLKQLKENPQVLAKLAPAYRAALAAGAADDFFSALGVDRTEAEHMLSAFKPDTAELQDLAFQAGGGPQATGTAQATGAQNQVRANVAAGNAGLPELQVKALGAVADNQIIQAAYESQTTDALMNADIPALSALGKAQDLQAGLAKGKYEGAYYDILNKNGQAQIVANAERSKALLGIKGDDFQSKQIDKYVAGINSIDQSTPRGRDLAFRASAYIANPGFAGYLAQTDEMDFRLRLANQANQPNPVESIKLGMDLLQRTESSLKTLNDLRTRDNGASKAEIAAAGQIFNNYASLTKDLSNNGIILPLDVTSYEIQAGLTPEKFTSNLVRTSAAQFTNALMAGKRPQDATSTDEKIGQVKEAISHLDEIARNNKYSTVDKREMGIFLTETLGTLEELKKSEIKGTSVKDRPITGLNELPQVLGVDQIAKKFPEWMRLLSEGAATP